MNLYHNDGRIKVCRRRGKAHDPQHTASYIMHGGGSVRSFFLWLDDAIQWVSLALRRRVTRTYGCQWKNVHWCWLIMWLLAKIENVKSGAYGAIFTFSQILQNKTFLKAKQICQCWSQLLISTQYAVKLLKTKLETERPTKQAASEGVR